MSIRLLKKIKGWFFERISYEEYLEYLGAKYGIDKKMLRSNPLLIDLGVDSLQSLDLICDLEEKYRICLDTTAINAGFHVNDLFNHVVKSVENSGRNAPAYISHDVHSIEQLFFYASSNYHDRVAYEFFENNSHISKTFRDVFTEVECLSNLIQKTSKSSHVAIIGKNSYYWILSHFAAVHAGKISILINPDASSEEIANIIDHCNCSLIFYDDSNDTIKRIVATMSELNREILAFGMIGTFKKHVVSHEQAFVYNPVKSVNDIAIIGYTSGTAGNCKGVMLSHGNIASNVNSICETLYFNGHTIAVLPFHHMLSLCAGIYCAVASGVSTFISNGTDQLIKEMDYHNPSYLIFVPMLLELIAKQLQITRINIRETSLKKLSFIAVGGASINEDCAEKFRSLGIHVLVGYGLTECSPVVSVNRISNYKVNSCGEILSCCKVRINSERKTLPGEVLVKGSNVMAGYYLNVDETNKVFEDGWFRTGDIGHINNNILYIVGRTKNIILLKNGENVYPEEVENKIKRINSVVDAVVFDLEGLIACEVFLGEDPSEEVLNNFRREMQSYNRNVQAAKRIQKIIIRHMPFEKTKLSKIIRGNIIANKQEC